MTLIESILLDLEENNLELDWFSEESKESELYYILGSSFLEDRLIGDIEGNFMVYVKDEAETEHYKPSERTLDILKTITKLIGDYRMTLKDLEEGDAFITNSTDIRGTYVGCVDGKAIVLVNGATKKFDCNTEVLRYVP